MIIWIDAHKMRRIQVIGWAKRIGLVVLGAVLAVVALGVWSMNDRIVPVQVSSAVQRGA